MKKIKFGYTEGDSFTLNNIDYVGKYVVYEDGGIYTSYADGDFDKPLSEKNTFKTDIINSSLFFDRTGKDTLKLPYVIEDVLIQPNEFVTSQIINDRLQKIYDNTIYLYSKLIAPKGVIPENVLFYSSITNVFSSTPSWIPPTFIETYNFDSQILIRSDEPPIQFFTQETYSVLDSITTIESILSPDEKTFTIIGCTPTTFVTLTGDYDNRQFDISISTSFVDDFNNDLRYGNITDTCRVGKFMYVCDSGNDIIHKYDISRLLVSQSNTNQRILIESLGGRGEGRNKQKFKNPTLLAPTPTAIYVWDNGNSFFKQYDTNFNHISTFRKINSFKEDVLSIGYNNFTQHLYCITSRDSEYFMYIMDSNNRHNIISKVLLDIRFEPDKIFKKILFSEDDSNIFYIVTNKHVYKKTVNNPDRTIGRFSYDKLFLIKRPIWNYTKVKFNQANFTWNYGGDESNRMDFNGMSLNSSINGGDMIFIAKRGRFYGCLEPNEFDRVLLCENYPNYGIESVELNSYDYVQASSINKEIYKVLRDLYVLYQNLHGRFNNDFDEVDTVEETTDAGVYRIKGYTYIQEEFKNIDFDNAFIHENELITPQSINRVFNTITTIQKEMFEFTSPDSNKLIPTTLLDKNLVLIE